MAWPRRRGRYKQDGMGDYNAAYEPIKKMEQREFKAYVKPTFKLDDVLRWMFPDDILDKLRAAAPYCDVYSHSIDLSDVNTLGFCMDIDIRLVNSGKQKIIPPNKAALNWRHEIAQEKGIAEVLRQTADIAGRWKKVRKVIKFFNRNKATPGLVMNYWPTMAALLPAHEGLRSVDGSRYKELDDMHTIIPLLRETQHIVAEALLLPQPDVDGSTAMTVRFASNGSSTSSEDTQFHFL